MGKYGAFPGGMGNMQNLMRQAQKMQEDLKRKQEEVANTEFEVSAGGGAITVTATGDKKISSIKIKQEVVDPEDVEMLEDLVLTAVNEAIQKAEDMMQESMQGFNVPGLM